jgi:hypothetical protein
MPKWGFNPAVALMQIVVGGARDCGKISSFFNAKFWQEEFVLHSIMTASVCFKSGSPTLYQQGYDAQEPSPGLKVLIVPVKFSQVKSCILTELLFGLPVTDPLSS